MYVKLELLNFTLGFLFSFLMVGFSYKCKSLSLSGLIGALIIGTTIYGFGGWKWFLLLILFFISSSFLTKYKYQTKMEKDLAEPKGGARTLLQSIGKGGVGSIVALLTTLWGGSQLALCFISAIGEANADTWAVEIGTISKENPRLITNLRKKVALGTSGGVSLLGEFAALLGAVFIALFAVAMNMGGDKIVTSFMICTISAFLGEHVDSLLGASVQAIYYCPVCKKETDRRVHRCGTRGKLLRGMSFINNEFVNFLSTFSAAAISLVLISVFL